MEIETILNWVSEDIFCRGTLVILILVIASATIIDIVYAITGYKPLRRNEIDRTEENK